MYNKKTLEKIKEGGLIAVIVIGALIIIYGISWILTCGAIKLITVCFGWTFKWSVASGIWIIICVFKSIFKATVNNKN